MFMDKLHNEIHENSTNIDETSVVLMMQINRDFHFVSVLDIGFLTNQHGVLCLNLNFFVLNCRCKIRALLHSLF